MALKDRFRRALNHPSTTTRSNSTSSSSTTNPPASSPSTAPTTSPSITLTKTSSRLSKKLTWRSEKSQEKKQKKKEEEWEEWEKKTHPAKKGVVGGKHQEMLKAFEWKWRSSMDSGARRRSGGSVFSGISPGQSRVGSVDDGTGMQPLGSPRMGSLGGGRRSSGSGHPGLERVRSGGEGVETVIEE